MKLHQLRQFVTLAETGNFHRAAERLHIAQPPLSVSIRKLESELGAALFVRTTSGVRLTAEGEAMLADARLTLTHAEQCRLAVDDARQGLGGMLRLGIIGSATYLLLPDFIPPLRRQFPKLRLELTEATSHEILEGLGSRRFDAGLVRTPMHDASELELLTLDDDDFVLAVSRRSPLAQRERIALAEAADEPFIMYPPDRVPGLFGLAMMRCQHAGFTPRIEQEAMQIQTIVSLVAAGLGVALVASVARHVIPRGVKCLTLTDNPAGLRLGIALARRRNDASRLLDRLSDYAAQFAARRRPGGGSSGGVDGTQGAGAARDR